MIVLCEMKMLNDVLKQGNMKINVVLHLSQKLKVSFLCGSPTPSTTHLPSTPENFFLAAILVCSSEIL